MITRIEITDYSKRGDKVRVIKFYFLRIQPIRFVIQAKSDLDECKNWYLNNKEQVLFMEEELLSNDK